MESYASKGVPRYCTRIRLAVSVQPNFPVHSCRQPRATALSSGLDALSARPDLDGRLSRADGQYSGENIPRSRIGFYTGCCEL